ncbi:flagellar basal body-associated FliL family protein [Palleronia sediminis]|uniref:Flagellar basal body-associated FliL family protein n=1 Tax=Palleronia sediminis TaxID=2547833 RepID=A0A4R5ZXQ7_9RHOB|nr:flagellar basal body-associated FliL family protein [Palleronia sediminis]TDL74208.1 flagellar basal body-associated FliL family protein [Palleronia sediminis]
MIAKLLPALLVLAGIGGGVGAGFALRPAPAPMAALPPCGDAPAEPAATDLPAATAQAGPAPDDSGGDAPDEAPAGGTFLKFDRQFVVPVLQDGRMAAMVVMGVTLELDEATRETAKEREPRLRDRFLRTMLDHANSGGFEGAFTSNGDLGRLRRALLEAGRDEVGPGVSEVLILDLARQDV